MVKKTKELIDSGISTIYEIFIFLKIFWIIVDILEITSEGFLYMKLKSSTSIKDIYLHDISIQYYTLEKLGMSVKGASLVYLNSNYVRDNELNLKRVICN